MSIAHHPDALHGPSRGDGPEAPSPDPEVSRAIGLGDARKRRLRAALIGLVVLALAAAGAVLWYRIRAPVEVHYQTAEVRRGALTVTVSATGVVQPVRSVDVGPQISGRVESVHADYNDRVTEGQVLVELDKRQLRARVTEAGSRLRAARSALVEARATAREAEKVERRTRQLVEAGIAPAQQLDTVEAAAERAVAAIESAKAQVSVAQAALAGAETDLAWATIRSPIDGIVLSRSVEPGQAVAAMFQPPVLFVIAEDLTSMELLVDIDEADVGRVESGQEATFTVDAYPGRVFDARVEAVRNLPRSVQGVVTYEAVLSVHNEELLLRPGMTADVVITTKTEEGVLLVPNAALRFVPPGVDEPPEQRRQERVWALREGEPERVIVDAGPTDGEVTMLLDRSVEPGTRVIIGVDKEAD